MVVTCRTGVFYDYAGFTKKLEEPITSALTRLAGMSRDGVSQLVERFHQRGVQALSIAPGRGRKPTYTSQDHQQILQEIQRRPTWDADQCTVWSLSLLQKSLHAKGFLDICPQTIRLVLQAHGWRYQQTTRAWHLIDQAD